MKLLIFSLKVAVLLFFIISIDFHKPEVSPSEPEFKKSSDSQKSIKELDENWYSIYFGDEKIGFSSTVESTTDSINEITLRALIKLNIGGVSNDLSFLRKFFFNQAGRLLKFSLTERTSTGYKESVGILDSDNTLSMIVRGSLVEDSYKYKLPDNTVFIEAFPFAYFDLLKPGKVYRLPLFLPTFRALKEIEIKISQYFDLKIDKTEYKNLLRVSARIDSFKTEMLVYKNKLIREENKSLGLVSMLKEKDEAIDIDEKGLPIDSILTFSIIKPDRKIKDSKSLKELSLILDFLPDAGMIKSDSRQTILKKEKGENSFSIDLKTRVLFPKVEVALSTKEKRFPNELASTYEIPASNPKIVKLAKEIVKDEKDRYKAALKINSWVHKNIKKELVDSFTALDVLKSMKGECQAHTYLFTALARSLAIPTKMVSGIVYSDDLGGFLYHAWPEVYIDNWIGLDPTFGEKAVNPTHIKLADSDAGSELVLAGFIGKIKIKIKEEIR